MNSNGNGILPPPNQLGLDAKYSAWFPNQEDAFTKAIQSDSSLIAACLPTGSGKSVLGALLAKMHVSPSSKNRAVILVSTKLLQDQEEEGFSDLVSIRGQGNYICRLQAERTLEKVTVDDAPCHAGTSCAYRTGGCYYYDRLKLASNTKEPVLSNYAYYLSQTRFGNGLGDPFTLRICDEAHLLNDELEKFFSLPFSGSDLGILGDMAFGEDLESVKAWAVRVASVASLRAARAKNDAKSRPDNKDAVRLSRRLERLEYRVHHLATLKEDLTPWFLDLSNKEGFNVVPLWPGRLYKWPSQTVFMSATMTEKTLDYLLSPEQRREVEYLSFPSAFPVENRPIVHVKTCDMSYNRANLAVWTDRIDQIIDRRLDRKGLIHTTSFDRARYLMNHSRHRGLMITHDAGKAEWAVARFKNSPSPAILVSPSMTTGVDLPHEDCRYVIVGKVPFRTSTDVLEKARRASDKEWANYQAAQVIVQECGRAVRSADDRAETIIVDDAISWFMKRARAQFPDWWLDSYRGSMDTVPDPLVRA